MKLSCCPIGIPMIMVDMGCEPRFQARVKELGLRHGTRFTVIQKAAFGGRVLFVNGSRFAVDRGFAQGAQVRPCIKYARTLGADAEAAALAVAAQMGELSESLDGDVNGLAVCEQAENGLKEQV